MKQFLAALFVFSLAIAQDASKSTAPPAPDPLDLRQKYLYSLDRIGGPGAWVGFAAHAGLDQLWKRPTNWDDGSDSFGVRMASHLGARFIHENVAFGVRALAHEDPRYFRKGRGPVLTRVGYAIVNTFEVHNDDGSLMPAYSLFVSCYATPAIDRDWHQGPFTLGREARTGTIGLGTGVAQSLWHEFSPDLRKKLPKRFR